MRELQLVVDNGLTQEQFNVTKQFLYKYALHYAPAIYTRLGYQIDSKFYGVEDKGNYIAHYRNMIKNMTLEDVNAAIKKYIQYDNIKFAFITKDAESLKNDLLSNKPSPIEYDTPKPAEVMEEDKIISTYLINFNPEKIKIVPVEDLFK
jgi:zinc protease